MSLCSVSNVKCSELYKLSRSNPQGSETWEYTDKPVELWAEDNRFWFEHWVG